MYLSVWLDGLITKSKAWNVQLHLSIKSSIIFLHVLLACIICSHCIITYSKVGRTSKPFTVTTTHSLCLLYSSAGATPTPQKLFRWIRLFSVIMHWYCSMYMRPYLQLSVYSLLVLRKTWVQKKAVISHLLKNHIQAYVFRTATEKKKKQHAIKFHHLPTPVLNETAVKRSISTHLHPYSPTCKS